MLRMMSSNAMSSIARNLKHVNEKIQAASVKRSQHLQHIQPRLVAVSKTKDVEMIIEAYDGGQRHFGENYINELHEKANDIELQDRCEDIQWHFIGHLQRNKIAKVLDVPNLFVIETVDNERLAKALNDAWTRYNKSDKLNIMIQCNTSGEDNKNGCAPQEVVGLVKCVREECPNLNLKGLMTIGRFDHDLSTGPNPDFQCLIAVQEVVCKEFAISRDELELSMGMSGDFEHAIEVGSTNVRVGTTIFGARSYPTKTGPPGVEAPVTSEDKATSKEMDSQVLNNEERLRDITEIKTDSSEESNYSNSNVDGYLQERLSSVKGHEEKVNDLFICGNARTCSEVIFYFGGDVQDYPENMLAHRDNIRYVEWNTVATSLKILQKFPSSLVIAVKATHMYLMTFAMYTNFVQLSDTHAPIHSEDNGALLHLHDLYQSVLEEIKRKFGIVNERVFPIRIIGFSKGCVVLNQFVFELHLVDKTETIKRFVDQFKSIHWLDGGHSGGPENTYVTYDNELKRLAALPCEIFINVTPYQIKDSMRVWLGKQEAKFHKKLKKFKAKVHRTVHFESEPGSIENHFKVLEEFA